MELIHTVLALKINRHWKLMEKTTISCIKQSSNTSLHLSPCLEGGTSINTVFSQLHEKIVNVVQCMVQVLIL